MNSGQLGELLAAAEAACHNHEYYKHERLRRILDEIKEQETCDHIWATTMGGQRFCAKCKIQAQ